jgi:uncharacterized cupredoxin-like copper-binding protein
VRVPTGECPEEFAGNPEVVELAAASPGGSYTWEATEPGTVWVACPVDGHCAAGQIIGITVA